MTDTPDNEALVKALERLDHVSAAPGLVLRFASGPYENAVQHCADLRLAVSALQAASRQPGEPVSIPDIAASMEPFSAGAIYAEGLDLLTFVTEDAPTVTRTITPSIDVLLGTEDRTKVLGWQLWGASKFGQRILEGGDLAEALAASRPPLSVPTDDDIMRAVAAGAVVDDDGVYVGLPVARAVRALFPPPPTLDAGTEKENGSCR